MIPDRDISTALGRIICGDNVEVLRSLVARKIITHLMTSMYAMTISTEQFKIGQVVFPVAQSALQAHLP